MSIENYRVYLSEMKLLQKIACRKIAQEAKRVKRRKHLPQLNSLQSVGVIGTADNLPEYKYIVNYFKQKKIEVDAIFFGETAIEGIKSIGKKGLTWLKLPKKQEIQSFADKEFDILFNFIGTSNLKTEYLHKISKAKFKVGFSESDNNDYDLNIDDKKNKKLIYLIEQAFFYIKKLNNQD